MNSEKETKEARAASIAAWKEDLNYRKKFWYDFWEKHGIENGKAILATMKEDPCTREMLENDSRTKGKST